VGDCIHLVKLCVGVDSVEALADWQARRLAAEPGRPLVHVTRMWPRRAAEILAGGSLYWVIRGAIRARQPILGLDAVEGTDGIRRCAIVLSPELVRTEPAPRRPFQGWRYLPPEAAPPDLPAGREAEEPLPAELAAALSALGVR